MRGWKDSKLIFTDAELGWSIKQIQIESDKLDTQYSNTEQYSGLILQI